MANEQQLKKKLKKSEAFVVRLQNEVAQLKANTPENIAQQIQVRNLSLQAETSLQNLIKLSLENINTMRDMDEQDERLKEPIKALEKMGIAIFVDDRDKKKKTIKKEIEK